MQDVGLESIGSYHDLLEADVDEFTALFDTLLINLTAFFRDPAAWAFLESDVLPEIISRRGSDQPVRIWSAGCATGEEPYSLAMAVANLLGVPETARRVKIYATDIDLDALVTARAAVYPDKALGGRPRALPGALLPTRHPRQGPRDHPHPAALRGLRSPRPDP